MIKYLYIPDFENGEDLFDKVCTQFLKKSYVSDAILIVVVESAREVMYYLKKYIYLSIGSGCQITFVEESKFPFLNYAQLIGSVDCYITGHLRSREFSYVEMAYNMGKDIISAHMSDIFEDMPINPQKLNMKNELDKIVRTQLIDVYPYKEWNYILFHQGLGESCAFFYCMKEYKEQINKKLVILCFDPTRKSLLEESPYIDAILMIPTQIYAHIAIFFAEEYNIKNFLLFNMLSYCTQRLYYSNYASGDRTYKDPTTIDRARDFLQINKDIPFKKYPVNVSQSKVEYVNNLFQSMGLKKGKTVFFVMDAISNAAFENETTVIFKKLVDRLREIGYSIVTKGSKEIIKDCPFTFLPPWESALFAGLCGNIISVPTGIAYVIGTLNQVDNINIQVIWSTDDNNAYSQNYDSWHLMYILDMIFKGRRHFITHNVKNSSEFGLEFFDKNIKEFNYITNEENLIEKLIANLN